MEPVLCYAEVSGEPLSVDRAIQAVSTPGTGGIGVFVGLVRDHDHGQAVTGLEYSAHPTVSDALAACAQRVMSAHPIARLAVAHRTGLVGVGEIAVVVAVSAEHRAPALDATRALIDDLKLNVPLWKRELFVDGHTQWVGLS